MWSRREGHLEAKQRRVGERRREEAEMGHRREGKYRRVGERRRGDENCRRQNVPDDRRGGERVLVAGVVLPLLLVDYLLLLVGLVLTYRHCGPLGLVENLTLRGQHILLLGLGV